MKTDSLINRIREKRNVQGEEDKGAAVRRAAGKGLVGLLLFMLLFTIISRAAASLTVARVVAEAPVERRIEHRVSVSGTIEKNRELAVLTEPDLLVGPVYAKAGQKVAAGELLAELDMEWLEEKIAAAEEEITILRLTGEAALANQKKEEQDRLNAASRAEEDYAQALADGERAASRAAEELKRAEDAYYSYEGAHGGDTSAETFVQLLALQDAMRAKQDACDAVQKSNRDAIKNAERAAEDAKSPAAADNSAAIARIQTAQKERQLEKLKKLAAAEGKITSPADGVVTEIFLETGQKTTDTAAAAVADLSSGMRFRAVIGKNDLKYAAVGDEVILEQNGKTIQGAAIDTLEAKEDGSAEITVHLTDLSFSIGETAVLELKKTSAKSLLTVPVTALHQENNKSYLYLLDQVDTVLGQDYQVRQMEVTVKDKNSQYAALEGAGLTEDLKVITEADRYIEAGSRVRLKET